MTNMPKLSARAATALNVLADGFEYAGWEANAAAAQAELDLLTA